MRDASPMGSKRGGNAMMFRRGYRLGNIWNEMERLDRNMNHLCSGTQAHARAGVFPPLNFYDDNESIIVRAEIPGIDPAELDINVTFNSLTIKGGREKEETGEKASFHRREREHGSFSRTMNLPQEVNPDNVLAKYQFGILEVILPKAEEAKPRRIQIEG
jgi:HSP20 family protein